jgi:hypothetical protein
MASPRDSFRLSHLGGSEGRARQTRIAQPNLDLGDAVAADAGGHGKGEATESKLQMGDL